MTDAPVALVTGSRKGIGKFLAERFVELGYRVVGCSRDDADWSLDGYEHIRADVGAEPDVLRLLAHVGSRYGRLDVAVNNAGIASMNHVLLMPGATAESIMRVNFLGTFLVARESAKLMRRAGQGRIVNLSSVAAPLGLEGEAVYAASKSAVETLTRVLAFELAPFGITVNAVGLPPIATDLIAGVPEDKIHAVVQRLAIKRLGELQDVSNAVEFLIKPESGYVTGQVLFLGGV